MICGWLCSRRAMTIGSRVLTRSSSRACCKAMRRSSTMLPPATTWWMICAWLCSRRAMTIGSTPLTRSSSRACCKAIRRSSASDNMVDDLRMALQQARDDDRVKGVVLEVDSPGGEVTASDMIYNAVVKTRARKPVVVYMDSLAASGGYYVSCGGKYLMANETTITGSIGVIIQTLNYEQLFNKVGLASVVFKSRKCQDLLNGARPMTPEEREFVQNFVMKTYDKFLGIVAKERNLPANGLRNSIADGRIFSGKEALENKLIDGVGQIEDAYAKAKQLSGAPEAAVVRYAAPFSLGRFFRALGETNQSKLQIELPKQFLPQLESGRAYFLPSYYAP